MCQDLPNKLDLKWMAFLPVKSKTGNLRFEQYFVDLYIALPIGTIHAPTTISMNKTHITHVTKQNLLDDIKKCIFGQKVCNRYFTFICIYCILHIYITISNFFFLS